MIPLLWSSVYILNMQEEKVAFITGISQGIGMQLVLKFLDMGYIVVGYSRKSLEEVDYLNDLTPSHKSNYIHLNCSIQEVSEKLVSLVNFKINVLISNAAQFIKEPADSLSSDHFLDSFNVNSINPFLLIQSLKLASLFAFQAHVVQICSMGGVQGAQKFSGLMAYSASKAALISITESMQVEWGHSLTFNALALGAVDTEMFRDAFFNAATEISDVQMADWIYEFAANSGQIMAGQVVQVKKSDP